MFDNDPKVLLKNLEENSELFCFQASPVAYGAASGAMASYVQSILQGHMGEKIWFLEHPHVYTLGVRGDTKDILRHDIPIVKTGRGGQVTYHGPGQRVGYVMLDLNKRVKDVRLYIQRLEQSLVKALSSFGIQGFCPRDRVGVWVTTPFGEKKIAAIGVRLKKWVTFHGFSINICPDLSLFDGIVPCGLSQYGVTSCHDLGVKITMDDMDQALMKSLEQTFFK